MDGEAESHTVFLYGPGMDADRMRERCPGSRGRRRGLLRGHRLTFDKIAYERDGTGLANAEPAADDVVEGALYEVSRDDLLRLDRFEGHPYHYSRRIMAVEGSTGERTVAWVYFARADARSRGLQPRPDHVAQLLAGADLLSSEYVARLRGMIGTADV